MCDKSSDLHDAGTDNNLGSDVETDVLTTEVSHFAESNISNIDLYTQISMPAVSTQPSDQNSAETIIYVLNSDSNNQVQSLPIATNLNSPIPVMSTSVTDVANDVVQFCMSNSITDPVEILRKLQEEMVIGRPLEVEDITQCAEGDTNFILIDRNQTMATGFDEINMISDLRKTLEVQFYNEAAMDYGGPRKEFFRLILLEIKQKYFDHGLRDLLCNDYEVVGKIFALSVLQNGKIPRIMSADILNELFQSPSPSPCIDKLRIGLNALGIYEVCRQLPSFIFLFHPTTCTLTYKMITSLLKPTFCEEGSNRNALEKLTYSAFLRYLREVASGRRDTLTLGSILTFVSGTDEEPVLGFKIHPSITFPEAERTFLPTANTCINCLKLPRPAVTLGVIPDDSKLFTIYDYAFTNTYYGLQ